MNATMILVLVSEEKNVLHANNNGSLIPIKDALDGAEMGWVFRSREFQLDAGSVVFLDLKACLKHGSRTTLNEIKFGPMVRPADWWFSHNQRII